MTYHLSTAEQQIFRKALMRGVKRARRTVSFASIVLRIIGLLARIPDWCWDLLIGLTWLAMAVIAIGLHEQHGLFVSFFGMMWWALLTKAERDVCHDMRKALDGWSATIDEFATVCEENARCRAALKLAYSLLIDKAAKEEIGALLNEIDPPSSPAATQREGSLSDGSPGQGRP